LIDLFVNVSVVALPTNVSNAAGIVIILETDLENTCVVPFFKLSTSDPPGS